MVSVLSLAAVMSGCSEPCMEGYGRDADDNCVPYRLHDDTGIGVPDTGDSGDTGTAADTATTGVLDMTWGDPILSWAGDDTWNNNTWEFVDIVGLDADQALGAGQGGYALVELADASHVWQVDSPRIYDLAWDPSMAQAYLGTRLEGVKFLDLTDRDDPQESGEVTEWVGVHEDLAASDGLLLVAAPASGAVLIDGATRGVLSTIEAGWASAVGLHEDRAVVADSNAIVLYDISEPTAPVELDRQSLRATARDLEFDGTHIGVALGGHGAAVLRVREDALVVLGELDLPGSSYGVALDGDYLWASAWSDVALIWLGAGGPVVLGTEDVKYSTLGIGAGGARAVCADWFATTAFEVVPGVAGPELVVPTDVFAVGDDPPTAEFELSNLGAMTLEATVSAVDSSVQLSQTDLVLEPGDTVRLVVTGETGRPLSTELKIDSNDPDELNKSISVRTGEQSLGQEHEDFTVEGYVAPDTTLLPYTLSEQRGRVTVLAYFAVY